MFVTPRRIPRPTIQTTPTPIHRSAIFIEWALKAEQFSTHRAAQPLRPYTCTPDTGEAAVKPFTKILLPAVLAACLAVSACNRTSIVADQTPNGDPANGNLAPAATSDSDTSGAAQVPAQPTTYTPQNGTSDNSNYYGDDSSQSDEIAANGDRHRSQSIELSIHPPLPTNIACGASVTKPSPRINP